MEPIVSRAEIRDHAMSAASCAKWGNGSIGNPWPVGTSAHAAWDADFAQLSAELEGLPS